MKFFWGLFMLFCIRILTSTTANQAVEARLKAALFSNYDKSLLPTHTKTNDVYMRLGLSNLKGLDFFQGAIRMNVWLKISWVDSRLVWDLAEYGNISIFRVPSSEVWVPDITLYNSHSPSETLADVSLLLYNDGTIFYLLPMSIEAICTLDLRDYPYDSQDCRLKMGSWTFDNFKITLNPSADKIDLEDFHQHPVWELVSTSAVKRAVAYRCCADAYENITFHLTVRRRESHGQIASSVIAIWLILIVFLIGPSSAGERIIFASFVFVALVVLSAALSEEVPALSVTRLGRFLIGGMLITAVVIVVNGLIYRFYSKDQPGHLKLFLFIDIGAFLVTVIILAISTGNLLA